MLLWINGPFGGGKTATAHELNRRLPDSVVCDPEHVDISGLTDPSTNAELRTCPTEGISGPCLATGR